jgi:hypothetical protein
MKLWQWSLNNNAVVILLIFFSLATATAQTTSINEKPAKSQFESLPQPDLKKIFLQQFLVAAQQSLLTDAAKWSINALAADPSSSSEQSVGEKYVTYFGIVKSSVDFAQARNDKQRAYAGAAVGVGVLTLTVPPAGALAGACLLAAQLTETALSVESSAEIVKAQTEVIRYHTLILESQQRILRSEQAVFQVYSEMSALVSSRISDSQKFISNKCHQLTEIEQTSLCLKTESTMLNDYFLLAQIYHTLAQFRFSTPDLVLYLESNGFSSAELEKFANIYESRANEIKPKLDKIMAEFNRAMTAFLLDQIRQNKSIGLIESGMMDCREQLDAYILKASLISQVLRMQSSEKYGLGVMLDILRKLDIKNIIELGMDLESQGCLDIRESDLPPQSQTAAIEFNHYKTIKALFEISKTELLSASDR